ncbi:MAG: hypothetical protein KDC38_10915 [Planctomycetes bacterium]|nr:hypothetical protein [Planctomycetota bacterium]
MSRHRFTRIASSLGVSVLMFSALIISPGCEAKVSVQHSTTVSPKASPALASDPSTPVEPSEDEAATIRREVETLGPALTDLKTELKESRSKLTPELVGRLLEKIDAVETRLQGLDARLGELEAQGAENHEDR